MSQSPTPEEALGALADRGTPRGADAVLAGARARAAASDEGLAPAPSERSGHPRRWLAAAAVVLVVVGLGTAIWRTRSEDRSPLGTSMSLCAALEHRATPEPGTEVDVVVYLEPGAPGQTIETVRSQLETDPTVDHVRYIDTDASYEKFRELFAGQSEMLENVRPSDLPTSFEVALTSPGDPAAFVARWQRDPATFEVRDMSPQKARALDILVWVGSTPETQADGSFELPFQARDEVWNELTAIVRAAATSEVLAAVNVLDTERDHRNGQIELDLDDPSYERSAKAADVVAAAAKAECGLTPLGFADDQPSGSSPVTTVTDGGD